jgi:sugar/nucleoside kinase (ribokinase family)
MAWRAAPIVLLAPVAREVDPAIGDGLRATTLGLAPQGWLRQWDESGEVSPSALGTRAAGLLESCAALILSREDLAGAGAEPGARARVEEMLRAWSTRVPNLVVTRGREGAELRRQGRTELFRGFPAHEVDPTGAGDVFAMTFLCALAGGATPASAMVEANQVAALSIEGAGIVAIPTPGAARARFARTDKRH